MTKSINDSNEDTFKEIFQKIHEIKSCLNIIRSSVENEYNPPEIEDINNFMEILSKYTDELIKDFSPYI